MSIVDITAVAAKAHVYISNAAFNANPTQDDYEAQTWVEIGDVADLGSWGAKGKEVTATVLGDGYTRRMKGMIDSGTVDLKVLRSPLDPGQSLARAAASEWDTYLFKVTLNDAPNETGDPSTFYFRASVMSAENSFADGNKYIETTLSLGITGAILEIPADVNITFAPAAGALTAATHSDPYTVTIAATGGIGVVSYAVTTGTLPAGLTLNAATGVISGTPSAAGSGSFSITATFDGAGEAVAAYTLAIS
jgi:hypothetical protein